VSGSGPSSSKPKAKNRARKEVTQLEQRQYRHQDLEAKMSEHKSWVDNDVYYIVDMSKHPPKHFVKGRWVLIVKRDKDGKFVKCKARWVLKGFQDKQKLDQQTDSPTSTRPGFRTTCQLAANKGCDLFRIDLKTAYLQGESYDVSRNVICQLLFFSGSGISGSHRSASEKTRIWS
jgi:hypothetical protein